MVNTKIVRGVVVELIDDPVPPVTAMTPEGVADLIYVLYDRRHQLQC